MGELQQRMRAKLESVGLPYKQIEVYGSQIVVTSHSRRAAISWKGLLEKFARVRAVVKTADPAKVNRGTCLRQTMVTVWRTFAVIEPTIHVTPQSLPTIPGTS